MENNIYSSPNSNLEIPQEQENELATRGSRLGAAFIDMLTIVPVTLPLMYFTDGFDRIAEGVQPPLYYTLGMALVGIMVFMFIHGYFLINNGQTLGKKFLDIKIVTLDNRMPQILVLAKRYGFYWINPYIPVIGPFINLVNILFIFSKSKRCLHDHVAGTKVVQVSELSWQDAANNDSA